jgi:hypothetical protein
MNRVIAIKRCSGIPKWKQIKPVGCPVHSTVTVLVALNEGRLTKIVSVVS